MALINGTIAYSISLDYCILTIFQFLLEAMVQTMQMDKAISWCFKSGVHGLINIFSNHVHASKVLTYSSNHRCIHYCCIEFLFWSLYFQYSICFYLFIRGHFCQYWST